MAAFLQIALLFFFVFFVFAFLRGLIEGFSGKTLEWDFLGPEEDDVYSFHHGSWFDDDQKMG